MKPLTNMNKNIMYLSRVLLLALVVLSNQELNAQYQEPIVQAEFLGFKRKPILDSLEKQSGYRLFYNENDMDTSMVSLSFNNVLFSEALKKLFEQTALTFTIDNNERNVFVTKGRQIQLAAPALVVQEQKTTVMVDTASEEDILKSIVTVRAGEVIPIGIDNDHATKEVILSGYVKDSKTGEPIIGASVIELGKNNATTTDQYGYFRLQLTKGKHSINIQSIGLEDATREVLMQGDGKINIEMQTRILTLKRVIISTQKSSNIKMTQLGVQKMDIKTIKQVPVVFGEADLLRILVTTPGVKTVGEASTGLNVRGGSADQNLILFNEMNIINPSHFFGMFSAFNPEVVKDVELFKGSIPAKYGGRLSSVVNINSREGNKRNITGSAGIGLLTSRINVEGPIIKDKTTFIFGGRTTYANWLLSKLPKEYKNSKASFYDVNLVLNHEQNSKNFFSVSAYTSNDKFNLNSDTVYGYGNNNATFKWKHIYNSKLNSVITLGYDYYQYRIASEGNPVNSYFLKFNISQKYFKTNFNYFINKKHSLEFGINANLHKLNPGIYGPLGDSSIVSPINMGSEQALESGVYLSDKYNITPSLSIEAGIRYSYYNLYGPYIQKVYADNKPLSADNLVDTKIFDNGKSVQNYHSPEFRIGIRQLINQTFSIKAGYNSLRQYLHMLSNTAAMAPTDIWKLSDPNIKPQFGDQISLGLYKNLKSNTIEISIEGYYKRIKNYLDYKSGAVLVLNQHIERDVIRTVGKAYGVEFLLKKQTGKLNGWISYTYSRILLKANSPQTDEFVNNGAYYPANYDIPHSATIVANYKLSHRVSVSLNSTYSSGRPITLPIGRFYYEGGFRTLYGDRNAHRIPHYFRSDFALNIDGNHKVHQRTHNFWTIGLYNFTGRRNPYSVYYISENGIINGYKLSIFGTIIPFVNFNIRF